MITETSLPRENTAIDICSNGKPWPKLCELHRTCEWRPKSRVFLNRLNDSTSTFRMWYALSKPEMLLWGLTGSKPNRFRKGRIVWHSVGWMHLTKWSYIGWGVVTHIRIRLYKTSTVSASHPVIDQRFVLRYGSETRTLKTKAVRRLSMPKHHCVRNGGGEWRGNFPSKLNIGHQVAGPRIQTLIG